MGDKPLNLFNYTDYRAFLRDYYEGKKAGSRSFSYAVFSRLAGINSGSFIRMVLHGKRNLSPASIVKLIKALQLDHKQGAYFEALVLFNQATDDKEKDRYFERLVTLRPIAKIAEITPEIYEYLTHRHYVVIREMVALTDFHEDPHWIAAHLNAALKPDQIKKAIAVLLKLNLLKRNGNGQLMHTRTALTTPADIFSFEIRNYHRSVLNDAKEAILNVPPRLRDLRAATLPVSLEHVPAIKRIIDNCCGEILALISKGKKNFSDIYQFNMQFYPVTKGDEVPDRNGKKKI